MEFPHLPNTDLLVDLRKHAVEMGFAVTVQKMQRQTYERVIVDFNERLLPLLLMSMDFTYHRYRVRKSCNFRLMTLQPMASNLDYMYSLKPSDVLTQWLSDLILMEVSSFI